MILDTNVISELVSPHASQEVLHWSGRYTARDFFVPAIVKAELFTGVANLPDGQRRRWLERMIATFLQPYEEGRILPFESGDAAPYATIVAARRRLGRPILESDAQIAAIARRRNLAVVTRNDRDFELCGIDLVNPWNPLP